jgi:hypothetical protein
VDAVDGTEFPPQERGAPSHRLHDCERWFARWIRNTGIKTPSGEESNGIRVQTATGPPVTLVAPNANRLIIYWDFPVRWAKDDSFLSFLAIDWIGGTPKSRLIRVPIEWQEGQPVALQEEERFLEADPRSTLSPKGSPQSNTHLFDWSPSGDQVVYAIRESDGRTRLYIYDTVLDTNRYLTMGDWPAWSSRGSDVTAPIAFEDGQLKGPGVFTIHPDGTKETLVTPPWTKTPGQQWRFSPKWSPDGTRLALTRTEMDLAYQQQRTWSVEVLDLASRDLVELTRHAHNAKEFLAGWR